MKSINFIFLFSVPTLILIAPPVRAATIYVPAGQPTIQAGIDAAVDGDIVLVAPGIYVENIDFLGKAIKVQSEAGAEVTVIEDAMSDAVVSFQNGEPQETVLNGFTLRNGLGHPGEIYSMGGGIYIDGGGSPTVRNCIITQNWAHGGGGIYCDGHSPTISNCTITGNTAECAFPPGSGGGILCTCTSPKITNCTITGNSADVEGGGIQIAGSDSPRIVDCTIAWNLGDGICGHGIIGPMTISGCTIEWNDYIGIYFDTDGDGSLMVENCKITHNQWNPYSATGIFFDSGTCSVTHCTISNNDYSGIYCGEDTSVSITNSILWGHSAQGYPEILKATTASVNVTYSDVEGGWSGTGNIDMDPRFVGGGDFHLDVGSPCVDAATDAGVYWDIDGDARPHGSGFDMGSDEYTGECWDLDEDGYEDETCGGTDCDDTNPLVYPGYPESYKMGNCTDGKDNDCDGLTDTDPECTPPCSARIVPNSHGPIAFYLIPALAFICIGRRFLRE